MAPSGNSAEALVRRHPVLEALRAGRRALYRLHVVRDHNSRADEREVRPILDAARAANVPVLTVDKQSLDRLAQRCGADPKHQGVLLEVGPYPYADVDEMLG
ncbi:MAG TPA: RNA methyltransferase substrate-binding domain-containing protein, partial [Promineifilum sp.]|nr:RNA methyltransferase substrate-binding domain-containing protein [Promineifilum sp.]